VLTAPVDVLTGAGFSKGDIHAFSLAKTNKLDGGSGGVSPRSAAKPAWVFLSYRQKDCVAEVSIVAEHIRRVHKARGDVFHDAEFHRDLAALVSIMASSANALVFLSEDYFKSVYCLTELCTAVKHKANIGLVYIQKAGTSKDVDDHLRTFIAANAVSDAAAGSLLNAQGWVDLKTTGYDVADVRAALRAISTLKMQRFSPGDAQLIREAEMEVIVQSLV